VHLRLRTVAPAWIRVTVDGRRAFQGILRPRQGRLGWSGHRAIFVFTYEPRRVKVVYNGRALGRMGLVPGLTVDEATPTGWQQVS
jgi:hypothetical protein